MDYCLSLQYYYHTDDKEWVLDGCKESYYQINFECYKDKVLMIQDKFHMLKNVKQN